MNNLIAIPGYEGLYAYDTVRDVVVSFYHDAAGKDVKRFNEFNANRHEFTGRVVVKLWKNGKCKNVPEEDIKQMTACAPIDQPNNDIDGVYFVAQIADLKPVFAGVPVHYTNQFHARETCERLARETPGTKWAYFRRLGVCEVEAVRWTA